MKNSSKLYLLVVLSWFIFFIAGFQISKFNNRPQELVQKFDTSLLWKVYDRLKKGYYDQSRLTDEKKLIYGTVSGLVKTLDDPYTEFLDPQKSKLFLQDIKGEFGGIGIEIGIRKSILTVIAPLEGTPAQKAGLKAGDKILKIDNKETSELTLLEAVSLIRGPKGTKIKLLIARDDFKEAKEFEIVRDIIKIPTLDAKKIDDHTLLLKLFNFHEKSYLEFSQIARKIINENIRSLILDLRNNPGGFLEGAIDIAGFFLPKGSVVTIESKQGEKLREFKSKGDAILKNLKTVVIINQGSASASEILAAALRDNLGFKIIGEKSFGKGSIQTIDEFEDDSILKYTIAEWLTSKGEFINQKGINPDIVVLDDENTEKDEVLEKAIEVLKSI